MTQILNKDDLSRDAWNQVAGAYQERYDIQTKRIHYGPLCPSEDVLQLLGDLEGAVLFELGSGAGQNAIVAAKQKARATAFDISNKQLEHGKKLAAAERVDVTFVEASFLDFSNRGYTNQADIVLSVYALQYCQGIEQMGIVFKAVYEALKPGGRFVFSLDHPIRAHGWWEQDKFVIDRYFDHDVKEWLYRFPEAKLAVPMSGTFKTLSDYFQALTSAGFAVRQILEPEPIKRDDNSQFGVRSQYGISAQDDPFSYDHLSRIPGTIIFQAFKPGSTEVRA